LRYTGFKTRSRETIEMENATKAMMAAKLTMFRLVIAGRIA
jgi:hypothetical protein